MTRMPLTLLMTTALVFPAAGFAQTAETACSDLNNLIVAGLPESAGDRDQLNEIVAVGQGDICLGEVTRITALSDGADTTEATDDTTLADTAQTTVRLQDEVTIAGRVLLDQSPPQVDIEEGATDVEIEPGAPTVNIAEQQGEIIIRQAPATVTVDMPTPTIRIEQAAPEIIITMPDPNVTVGAAQPLVRVVRAEPVISVTQAPPSVNLELAPVEDGGQGGFEVSDGRSGQSYATGTAPAAVTTEDATINFMQSEPNVSMVEPTEQARVQIEQAQPIIRFEQADPVVNFTDQSAPNIEFTQSGEPTVTFEQAGADTQEASETSDQPAALADNTSQTSAEPVEPGSLVPSETVATDPSQDTDVVADTAATDMAVADANADVVETQTPVEMAGPSVEREGYNLAQIGEVPAENLMGRNLYGVNDEDIGKIEDFVLSGDGQIESAIVEFGGFLGLGQKKVSIPFSRLSILQSNDGDIRVYIEATQEELEAMPNYQ